LRSHRPIPIGSRSPTRTIGILVFTDAVETLEGEPALVVNARVKRALRAAAFLTSDSIESRFRRKLLLAFGNPIPCPAVMLNRRLLGSFSFEAGWRSNLDWRAWITLAKRPGAFVYVARPLVHRTLHRHAATTRELEARAREDDRMFREIWPAPIAAALSRIYSVSRRPYSALRTAHDR
jgi:hypothetical protein